MEQCYPEEKMNYRLCFVALVSLVFLSSCAPVMPPDGETLRKNYPLAETDPAKIPVKIEERKSRKDLSAYAELELKTPNDKLIAVLKEKYGDFGIPGELPKDKELLDYLLYGGSGTGSGNADFARVPYLHIGKELNKNLWFCWRAGALRNLWLYYGDESAREKSVIILKYALRNIESMSDQEVREKINAEGLMNLWHPLMKSAAYYYAELYAATGDEHYAGRACLILERFGEVIDKWKIYCRGKDGKQATVSLDKPVPADVLYGLWGWWGDAHDLSYAQPLLEAWILIKNSAAYKNLRPEKQKIIYQDLLCGLVEKHLLFKFRPLHNQNMNRIQGLAYFGTRLNKPEYIHQAVRWMNDMLHIAYRRDGMWCEGTPSYGMGVTRGLIKAKETLKGWSDPKGYLDPVDKGRFDNFDPEKEFGRDFARIKSAFDLLALPDGNVVALEDTTWNGKGQFFGQPPVKSEPFLIEASGIGMMGFGEGAEQIRLYLHWEGTHGHDHLDCAGFCLWACGEEVSSETAYRGLGPWNKSTASHNTVLIDEKNQGCWKQHRRIKSEDEKLPLYPQYKYRELWQAMASFDDGGSLILWDTAGNDVQVAEIDGLKAYDEVLPVSCYRRTMALVRTESNNFYIVDIFRVKGGNTNDWMLHGNLAKKYKITIAGVDGKELNLSPVSGKIGPYLENLRSIKSRDGNFAATFTAPEKGAILRSITAGGPGTEIILAEGPAIRLEAEPSMWLKPGDPRADRTPRSGKSEFLCLRRKGAENVFVSVIEAYKDRPTVKDIELVKVSGNDPAAVAVKIKTSSGREDLLVSTLEGNAPVEVSGYKFEFTGRMLFAGGVNNPLPERVSVFDAGKFCWGNMRLDRATYYTGEVVAVSSVDRGDRENSFTVGGNIPAGEALKGRILLVYDGESRPHPYTIARVEPAEKIITSGETGMIMTDKGIIMTFYPGWEIPGRLTYRIPGRMDFKN